MSNDRKQALIFGEVLFDCFPTGERVLGGAPFNVAWHLQALGDRPHLISRVGGDPLGNEILRAMRNWGMDTTAVQIDPVHPTGRVEIEVIDGEPHYTIVPDCAYDFITADDLGKLPTAGILYHGTLGLRHTVAREAFLTLAQQPQLSIFLDVNLRAPWWERDDVYRCLQQARWVKLNENELRQLGFAATDLREAMRGLLDRFRLDQLIVTRGGAGVMVLTGEGECHHSVPEPVAHIVDTVGAGDAFTAIYLHGLLAGRPTTELLPIAQRFASKVIGLRGAVSTDPAFYRHFID